MKAGGLTRRRRSGSQPGRGPSGSARRSLRPAPTRGGVSGVGSVQVLVECPPSFVGVGCIDGHRRVVERALALAGDIVAVVFEPVQLPPDVDRGTRPITRHAVKVFDETAASSVDAGQISLEPGTAHRSPRRSHPPATTGRRLPAGCAAPGPTVPRSRGCRWRPARWPYRAQLGRKTLGDRLVVLLPVVRQRHHRVPVRHEHAPEPDIVADPVRSVSRRDDANRGRRPVERRRAVDETGAGSSPETRSANSSKASRSSRTRRRSLRQSASASRVRPARRRDDDDAGDDRAVTVPGSLAIEARSHETLVHSVAGSALWIRKIPAAPVSCSLCANTAHVQSACGGFSTPDTTVPEIGRSRVIRRAPRRGNTECNGGPATRRCRRR